MTTFTIDLPDKLAKEAGDAGLLAPEAVEEMLREAVRQKAVGELFDAADRLVTAEFPFMSMDEIQNEVNIVRAQRQKRAPGA